MNELNKLIECFESIGISTYVLKLNPPMELMENIDGWSWLDEEDGLRKKWESRDTVAHYEMQGNIHGYANELPKH